MSNSVLEAQAEVMCGSEQLRVFDAGLRAE
jgi:hypothetical protein